MRDYAPCIGIDFGTTNSSMAWYDPRTGTAEVIKNVQGEDKTPSLVYFGEDETLVGKPVDEMIEDASEDRFRRQEVFDRTVPSVKRNLVSPPRISLPGGRFVRPVDVAAEILKKMKQDAEEGHFHEEIERAVITCPAEFNAVQRKKIEEAGSLAGFEDVVLVEEPVAAALSYARAGFDVGEYVLVYDLGGGTFDLAVLVNEGGSFHGALQPKGMERCGGDDFDYALYYHCDGISRERLGRPISLAGNVDLKFLRLCRRRKENLTWQERVTFSNYLASENGLAQFIHEVDRETFEELVEAYIEATVQLTEQMLEEASAGGCKLDAAVLIGGSSKVPLVRRMLAEALPAPPLRFDKGDIAVALGAAHHANALWGPKPKRPTPPKEPRAKTGGRTTVAPEPETHEEDFSGDFALAHTLAAHARSACSVALSADGRVLVSGGDDKTVRLWDPETGAPLPSSMSNPGWWASNGILAVAVSADGRLIAGGGADRRIRIWDRETGGAPRVLNGHGNFVRSIALDADGRVLVSGGDDKTVRLWDLSTGEPLGVLTGHSGWWVLGGVLSVSVSPDGRLLASGGRDKTVRLWDVSAGRLLRVLKGHRGPVNSVAFGPGGCLLASGSDDGMVKVWDPEADEPLRTFTGHSGPVTAVAASPDGRLLVTGGEDRTVRLWDLRTGGQFHALNGHPSKVLSVAIGIDGQTIASGDGAGTVKVWRRATNT